MVPFSSSDWDVQWSGVCSVNNSVKCALCALCSVQYLGYDFMFAVCS